MEINHSKKLKNAFDKLEKVLLNLKSLPLAIVGVKCTSAHYRKTKPHPSYGLLFNHSPDVHIVDDVAYPLYSGSYLPFLPSIKILISLERGGKWGDDLTMISKLKSVFYIDLSRRLKVNANWFTVPTEEQLFVVLDRIVFSIKTVHPKEITLLLQAEKEIPSKKWDSGLKWKKNSSNMMRKKFIHKPLISQQLYGLTQRSKVFGETCVCVRQWLGYNYLSKMFEGMAIELLVANLFINDTSAPASGLAGFARFIEFLATYDFVSNPVIVDINNSFLQEGIEKAREEFVKRRPALPPLVIITPEDIVGTTFTSIRPEPVVFLRAIKLAKVAHKNLCSNALKENNNLEFELPIHDFSIYDIVIHINEQFTTIIDNNVTKRKSMGFKKPKSVYLPVVDFDPVKTYVETLRSNYNSLALFFYNSYKTDSIGVLLRPTFLLPRDAKVITNCQGRIKNEANLEANIKGLMDDLKLIGGFLVRNVVLSKKHKALNHRE